MSARTNAPKGKKPTNPPGHMPSDKEQDTPTLLDPGDKLHYLRTQLAAFQAKQAEQATKAQ
jgi:hypothetical protein